jgi:hypothetical protein
MDHALLPFDSQEANPAGGDTFLSNPQFRSLPETRGAYRNAARQSPSADGALVASRLLSDAGSARLSSS